MEAPEIIYFSGKFKRKPRCPYPTVPVIHGLVNVALLVGLILVRGGQVMGFGALPGALLSGTLAVLAVLWCVAHVARRSSTFEAIPNPAPDESRRLNCVGPREYLERHGPLADLPFEPAIFHSIFVQKSMPFQTVVFVLLMVPALVVTHYFLAWFMGKPEWSWQILFKIWLAIGMALWFSGWMWPTYFRIVPGRLEVMRFSNLRGRPVAIERFDLRGAKIIVDLRRSVIFIDGEDRRADFAFLLMRGRTRFAYYVLLAALSSHEPPPLPDDALLG